MDLQAQAEGRREGRVVGISVVSKNVSPGAPQVVVLKNENIAKFAFTMTTTCEVKARIPPELVP